MMTMVFSHTYDVNDFVLCLDMEVYDKDIYSNEIEQVDLDEIKRMS